MNKKAHKVGLSDALILALADDEKRERLHRICDRLSELDKRVKPMDYVTGEKTSWLEMVRFGIGGVKFTEIAQLFKEV